MSLSTSLSFYIKAYFSLSPTEKEICRLLYSAEIKIRKGRWHSNFMSKRKIAETIGCSQKTIKRFNRVAKGVLIHIKERFDRSRCGRQTSNVYEFDKNFFDAMHWMDLNNLLKVSKKRGMGAAIRQEEKEEREEKLARSVKRICPPSIQPPLSEEKEYKKESFIHPEINKIRMSRQAKVIASRYSEYCIARAIEDLLWYLKKGHMVKSIEGFIISRLKHWKTKKPYEN
jgi:hypothetical protein